MAHIVAPQVSPQYHLSPPDQLTVFDMASICKLGFFLVGVLIMSALLSRVCIRATDFFGNSHTLGGSWYFVCHHRPFYASAREMHSSRVGIVPWPLPASLLPLDP